MNCATSFPGLFPLEHGINGKKETRDKKQESTGRRQGFFPPLPFFQGKPWGRGFIFAFIVNLSIDNVDGIEKITCKMNYRFFKILHLLFQLAKNFKCRRISLKLISWGSHSTLEGERKFAVVCLRPQ